MDRTERLYRIDLLLNERKVVPVDIFLSELGVSLATFKRDLEYLRDRLNAPVIWDRDAGGYRFDRQAVGDKFELPGLWFSASEIHALLTMQALLASLGPGLITPHVEPLLVRLRMLLDRESMPADSVMRRIRIQRSAARTYEPQHFTPLATATLQRRRAHIEHYNRDRNEVVSREISPQRLNYYRENWYVDAYCHVRNQLRIFALDAIRNVVLSETPALEIPDTQIRAALDGGYGIFSGLHIEWAELVFTPERARWVSKETWHPEQASWFDEAGGYHLKIPFSSTTELVMDILRYVPEVRVVEPEYLREQLKSYLEKALAALQST